MSVASRTLIWLAAFAVAMANVEAALVIHLRSLYYPGDPLSIFPLALLSPRDLAIELVRETATLVMILAAAMLAARGFVRVFAAFAFTFGLWDIMYYAWLWLLIGWPRAWLEWDVLFLIPWPWFGPWICPAAIAALLVAWGAWVLCLPRDEALRFGGANAAAFLAGAVLALTAFLLPAAPLLAGGEAAFAGYAPGDFSWTFYLVGVVLMGAGLWRVATTRQA